MFVILYRFFKSLEMGLRLSKVAGRYAYRPEMMRAYILAEMGAVAIEPATALRTFETSDEELQLAA